MAETSPGTCRVEVRTWNQEPVWDWYSAPNILIYKTLCVASKFLPAQALGPSLYSKESIHHRITESEQLPLPEGQRDLLPHLSEWWELWPWDCVQSSGSPSCLSHEHLWPQGHFWEGIESLGVGDLNNLRNFLANKPGLRTPCLRGHAESPATKMWDKEVGCAAISCQGGLQCRDISPNCYLENQPGHLQPGWVLWPTPDPQGPAPRPSSGPLHLSLEKSFQEAK